MARPTRSLLMARKALSALLAAIEIGNKTVMTYQEETFCLLLLNAWEILLKARLVQSNNNQVEAIFQRQPNGSFHRNSQTNTPHTIDFTRALNLASVSNNTRSNLLALNAIRNDVAHLGILSPELRTNIRLCSSASIINFSKLYSQWFGETPAVPYLLPLAFIGKLETVVPNRNEVRQRDLLNYLSQLNELSDASDTDYVVTLHVDTSLTPMPGGGGTIGVTTDPNVPKVQLSDTQIVELYPWTFDDLVSFCKEQYLDFKQNSSFYDVLKQLKLKPECAFNRRLDPNNTHTISQWRYNPTTTANFLGERYIVLS